MELLRCCLQIRAAALTQLRGLGHRPRELDGPRKLGCHIRPEKDSLWPLYYLRRSYEAISMNSRHCMARPSSLDSQKELPDGVGDD